MGSKKVKAISFYGEKKREMAHPDQLDQFAKETLERAKDSPAAERLQAPGDADARGHEQCGRWVPVQILAPRDLRGLGKDQCRITTRTLQRKTQRLPPMLHGLRESE